MNISATDQTMSLAEKANTVDERIQRLDWSVTPLGDRKLWPTSLIGAIDTLLASAYPVFLFWGSEPTFFYNDAADLLFAPVRQPEGLHTKAMDAWPAMWYRIQPLINEILQGSPTPLLEDVSIAIYRNNILEEAYWNFSFSRIKGNSGTVAGVMV
ncbi:MAG TPA: hypothetical protein VD794_16045, partial [Flavisolibacter sp.]|nr:hypothetical protein [Flavisolibacter sp.]